jgi:hypothetical protein
VGQPQSGPRSPAVGLAALARPSSSHAAREERLAVVRLRFDVPSSMALHTFTHAHPGLVLRVLSTLSVPGPQVLTDIEMVGEPPVDYSGEMGALPGVRSVARLGPVDTRTRYHIRIDEPVYLTLANEYQTLLRYPRVIQNGEYTVEVAAPVVRLRELIDALRKVSPSVTILRFGHDRMQTCPPTLSPQQFALLQRSLAAGYFDVPRRTTLTALASGLGRSKSSVSRALAVIERELALSSVMASV